MGPHDVCLRWAFKARGTILTRAQQSQSVGPIKVGPSGLIFYHLQLGYSIPYKKFQDCNVQKKSISRLTIEAPRRWDTELLAPVILSGWYGSHQSNPNNTTSGLESNMVTLQSSLHISWLFSRSPKQGESSSIGHHRQFWNHISWLAHSFSRSDFYVFIFFIVLSKIFSISK